MPFRMLFLCAITLLPATTTLAQDSPPTTDSTKAWFAFYHREAQDAYQFTLQPDNAALQLDPAPILRWTNPLEEGDIHGVVYVWRLAGRPVVVGQLFSYLNGNGGRTYCHAMHSLARTDEMITGLRDGQVFWTPKPPGIEFRDVPGAPQPADGRPARLTQMKAIARRFSAFTEEAARGKRILRLLPTPLDRHPETAGDQADGALFSFAVGNDPEVILVIEQRPSPDGKSRWRYALVQSTRSTSVAQLDDKETWRRDSGGLNPADPANTYLSVHGIATLPLAAPDR